MAFSDFPFAEFLQPADFIIVYTGDDSETHMIPPINALEWIYSECECYRCSTLRNVLAELRANNVKRVELEGIPFNMVLINSEMSYETLAAIALLLSDDYQGFIAPKQI